MWGTPIIQRLIYKLTFVLILDQIDSGNKFVSAQLKIYWKPELPIVRQRGSFRATVYDIIKPGILSSMDVKKIKHKCAEEDEGNNT